MISVLNCVGAEKMKSGNRVVVIDPTGTGGISSSSWMCYLAETDWSKIWKNGRVGASGRLQCDCDPEVPEARSASVIIGTLPNCLAAVGETCESNCTNS